MNHHINVVTTLAIALFAVGISDVRSQSNRDFGFVRQRQTDNSESAIRTGTVSELVASPSSGEASRIRGEAGDLWLLTERLTEKWDSPGSTWVWASKAIRQYDQRGLEAHRTYVNWRSDAWQNDRRWLSVFDNESRLVEEAFQRWQISDWVNDYRTLISYDEAGKLTEIVLQTWENSGWVNNLKGVKTYDASGRMTEESGYEWTDQQWVQLPSLTQYGYDTEERLITETSLLYESGDWKPFSRQVVVFDAAGNQTNRLYEIWSGNVWTQDMRFSYKYHADTAPEHARKGAHPDNETITERLLEMWRDNRWNNSNRLTGTFDELGRQIVFTSESWDESRWIGIYRNLSDFDNNGLLATVHHETWTGSDWQPRERSSYAWQRFEGTVSTEETSELPVLVSLGQNYPNPFNPSTTISYAVSVDGPARLVVFDALGRIVSDIDLGYRAAGAYVASFDGSALSSGIYVYRIETPKGRAQRTMTLLK